MPDPKAKTVAVQSAVRRRNPAATISKCESHDQPNIDEQAFYLILSAYMETVVKFIPQDRMQEFALGMPTLHRMRRSAAASPMEKTGHAWRARFGR